MSNHSKSKFTESLVAYREANEDVLKIERQLLKLIESAGFDNYFVTFSVSDGILLANRDGDQWMLTDQIMDALFNSSTEQELILKLNDPKNVFQI